MLNIKLKGENINNNFLLYKIDAKLLYFLYLCHRDETNINLFRVD